MIDVECSFDEAKKVALKILYKGKLKVCVSGKMAKLFCFASYFVSFYATVCFGPQI